MFARRGLTLFGWLPVLLFISCQNPATEPVDKPNGTSSMQAPSFRQSLAPSVRVVEESPQGITLQSTAGHLNVGARRTHDRLFSTLDCPSCGWTNELGKPRLPVVRRYVEVPFGAQVNVEFEAGKTELAPLSSLGADHLVFPVQRPVPKLPGAREQIPFEMDEVLYSTDGFYPEQAVQVSDPFVIRGHQLVLVEYAPYQYNPYRAEVRSIRKADIRLAFEGKSAVPAEKRYSAAFDSWFASNVINHHPRMVTRDISTDKYAEGFLFVVGNAYTSNSNLLNYIDARRAEGHYVSTVPMSDIGTTDAQLRSYIRTQYLNWTDPSLSYVVLVGDTDQVPVHDGSGGGNSQVTDLYYASIDPDNYSSDLLYPDIMVSRISISNATELDTYINRASNYIYADFPTDIEWMNKLSFIASSDHSSVTEGTHNYVITNYTAPMEYTGTYPSNPQLGGDQLYAGQGGISESVIQTHLDDGRLMINFSGHGGETSWADPTFTQTYLAGVQPPDAAPFVISNACVTGSFGESYDCWGEMWIEHSHGAILFWGSSNNSYWDEDDILERQLWDGVYADGITRLADIVRNAKLETLAHYGVNATMEYYFEMYNALGDSTIDFYTSIPFDATATYATAVPVGIGSLDFSVSAGGSALEGALVCVRGGSVQQVGTTDASGQVTLILDPVPDQLGDLQVTITAHNMRRHEGVIQVISADGPYLVHDSHEVTSDGTTPMVPNPGRHVILPITLHNIGNQTATGVSGTLSSASPDVTITQDQVAFPDIAADAMGRSSTHAEFDIHPDALDGTSVNFDLDWTTAEGESATARFVVSVLRPILVYVSHAVDDSAGGCDQDGIADANEATEFQVTIENQGSGDASQVTVDLSAPDCADNGPVSVGDVPSGQQAVATFTVTPQSAVACPAEDVSFDVLAGAYELPVDDQSSFLEVLNADIELGSFFDDMEGGDNGWTHDANVGTDDWAQVTTDAHSPATSWYSEDVSSTKDASLYSPVIPIGDVALLSFWQKYEFESGWDGGVLEISTDGGTNFSDLGDYITQNGYNDELNDYSNPIGGRLAWSGTMDWHEVIVDLSSFGPGEVMLRFRIGCDSSAGREGWFIDDVLLDAETVVCQAQTCDYNRPPVADAGPDQSVDSGDTVHLDGSGCDDPDNDSLDYDWNQTEGPDANLTNPQAMSPVFVAPDVQGEVDLVFELTVSDGELDDTDSVTITVWGGCDDGNHCTGDTWDGASCQHEPLADCTLCPNNGICMDGICQAGAQGHDVPCNDGNGCTQTDVCQGGSCVGSDPVTCTALDACHVAGECEPATGVCTDPSAPDGTSCDDGNGCTQTDTCLAGSCSGADPVTCTSLDACHVAGVCDPATGVCTDPAAPDGTACDDASLCTSGDNCQAGVCTGADTVVCTASDQCHVAGVCDPMTGECNDPPATDGTACDDGNLCTQADCQAGVCTAGDPVVCEPMDSCHQAGECNPADGTCSNPVSPDGTACDDGNGCTQTDTCSAGVCNGGDPVACQPLDACHQAGVCNPATGECTNPEAPNGTACDDENGCTQTDVCQAGVCTGLDPMTCPAQDECHGDGECDPQSGACSYPTLPDGTDCPGGMCWEGVCVDDSASGCGCAHAQNPAAGLAGFGLLLIGLWFARSRRDD